MRVIILAAGEGLRLRPMTLDKPKCLVKLLDQPLINYQLKVFEDYNIKDINRIAGYKHNKINISNINKIVNKNFNTTNMVYSLMCAKNILNGDDDVIITYGDIIFEKRVFESIFFASYDLSITIDKGWKKLWSMRMNNPLEDAESLKLYRDQVIEIGKKPRSYSDIDGQYMGIIKIKAKLAKKLVRFWESLKKNSLFSDDFLNKMYFTTFLQNLINHGWILNCVEVSGGWLEVDSIEDLQRYEKLAKEKSLINYIKI